MAILDLHKIEQELALQLPAFFKQFHQEQQALITHFREVSNDADYIILSSDTEWLITHNRDFLGLPSTTGVYRNKLCIGTDGCGNDAFISLIAHDTRVFFLDHEESHEYFDQDINDFKWEDDNLTKYNSLEEYVRYYIEIYTAF